MIKLYKILFEHHVFLSKQIKEISNFLCIFNNNHANSKLLSNRQIKYINKNAQLSVLMSR